MEHDSSKVASEEYGEKDEREEDNAVSRKDVEVLFAPSMEPVELVEVADSTCPVEGLGRTRVKPSVEAQFAEHTQAGCWLD